MGRARRLTCGIYMIELWYEQRGEDPYNNDNYCALRDALNELAAEKPEELLANINRNDEPGE
ncbi:MAG: hypothetical protein BWY82_02731 [Verrucomicrobia bacterium ADurb.Bin474]|nr:MAG: hypothetical protein BWY82_02731 [Verrucomicrobia bacterium ADurb.Bin474]